MVGLYLQTLWSDMVARMSGLASLAFTSLGVFSPWFSGVSGTQYARWFFYGAAVICFLFANYRVWADEHKKVISSRPALEMGLEQMFFEYSKENDTTACVFSIFMLNKGAASIARNWQAMYYIGNASERVALVYPTADWILKKDNETITVTPQDSIVAKTMERRIEIGEAKTGRIFFTLQGDRADQFRSLQFRIEISCMDFLGQVAKAEFKPDPTPIKFIGIYPTEKGTILQKPSVIPPNQRLGEKGKS
jgi:hypothetical protein